MNKKLLVVGLLISSLLTGCMNQDDNNASNNQSAESENSRTISKKDSTSVKKRPHVSKLTLKKANEFLKKEVKPSLYPQELPDVKNNFINLHGQITDGLKSYSLNFSNQQKKPDNNLTDENLIVKYQEQELSPSEIENQINWIAEEHGLPEVDLGYNIKATIQGAAGSTYLNWNEGKWSITIRSSNQVPNSNIKAQELARQLVAYFEKNALEAPSNYGSIKIIQDSTDNQKIQIKFDHQQTLISINGPDIFTVLNFATKLS